MVDPTARDALPSIWVVRSPSSDESRILLRSVNAGMTRLDPGYGNLNSMLDQPQLLETLALLQRRRRKSGKACEDIRSECLEPDVPQWRDLASGDGGPAEVDG